MAAGGIELPGYSKVVIGLGTWMRDNFLFLAIGFGALLIGGIVLRGAVINVFFALMRRLPLMKDVLLAQESARFFSVMAAMTRTGVPIGDALGVANQAVTHPTLRGQLERLRTRLIEGGMLRSLIEEVVALPVATRRLLVAAERSGDLETAFSTLATDMTDEVDKKSQRLLSALEPALIVFMFLVIGGLMLSIMLPLLTLTSKVAI
jgi:general secretion pathway protein F